MSGWLEQERQLQAGEQQNLGGKIFPRSRDFCNENTHLTRFNHHPDGASSLAEGVMPPGCTEPQ